MNTRRIAGWIAAISGILLLLGVIASTLAAPGTLANPHAGGLGRMMGAGMMGPGMMGARHMGGYPGMMQGFGGSTTAGGPPIAGAPEARVVAANFSFSPTEIRLPVNAPVNLTLANPTGVLHDLTVPALGIQIVAGPGQTSTVGLRGLPAGRYPAFCSVPGHAEAGMRATIVVE